MESPRPLNHNEGFRQRAEQVDASVYSLSGGNQSATKWVVRVMGERSNCSVGRRVSEDDVVITYRLV